jgi:hypothetical protein
MHILRKIIVSLLIAVFVPLAMAASFLWAGLRIVEPGFAESLVAASRIGERLPDILEPQIKASLDDRGLELPDASLGPLLAGALPPADTDKAFQGFVGGITAYIRGESDKAASLDFSAAAANMKAAATKYFPGKAGAAIAGGFDASIGQALVIPADQLEVARKYYEVARLSALLALLVLLALFASILFAAPGGWRARLGRGGLALLAPGILIGLEALFIAKVLDLWPYMLDQTQPEARALAGDLFGAFTAALASRLAAFAAVFGAAGIACLAIRAAYFKKPASGPR